MMGSSGISSIGGGAISSNAYANGANQNCGNVMTGRSSTRIHAPPGGGSQISFGGYGDAANNRMNTGRGRTGLSSSGAHITNSGGGGGGGLGNIGGGAISSNAYANGANQNCGNVMTGRSSTRIHAPPGGGSQI